MIYLFDVFSEQEAGSSQLLRLKSQVLNLNRSLLDKRALKHCGIAFGLTTFAETPDLIRATHFSSTATSWIYIYMLIPGTGPIL